MTKSPYTGWRQRKRQICRLGISVGIFNNEQYFVRRSFPRDFIYSFLFVLFVTCLLFTNMCYVSQKATGNKISRTRAALMCTFPEFSTFLFLKKKKKKMKPKYVTVITIVCVMNNFTLLPYSWIEHTQKYLLLYSFADFNSFDYINFIDSEK